METDDPYIPARPKPRGRGWAPGQSGNPGGRVGVPRDVRELARAHTKEAIEVLAKCMRSEDLRTAVVAANALLSRAWGLPTAHVMGDVNASVITEIKRVILHEQAPDNSDSARV